MTNHLIDPHFKELKTSGLNDATIALAGIYSASYQEISAILGFPVDCGGMVFPYKNLGDVGEVGEVNRIKLDKKIDGTQYRTKSGGKNHLYLTHLTYSFLQDASEPICFTEGEKKALKASQDFMPTVGLSGVWSWKTKDDNDESKPIPDLDLINFKERQIEIFFDSDAASNQRVRFAEMSFAHECKKRGATKIIAYRIPPGRQGSKVGIDDYLLGHSTEELKGLPAVDPLSCYKITEAIKAGGKFKSDYIVDAVIGGLNRWGYFIKAQSGELFYFDDLQKHLYSLMDNSIRSFLSFRYQINSPESTLKCLCERIKTLACELGENVHVHSFAHYDAEINLLYVYTNNHKMFRLNGKDIQLLNNGDDGVLFRHDPLIEPIHCEISDTYDDLISKYILQYAKLNENILPADQQLMILKLWLLCLFFPELLPTRVILLFCGPKGSSKTTVLQLIGRFLFGRNFNVTSVSGDKEDAFVATISSNYFAVFDNVDGRVMWFQDSLARAATGQDIRRRKYYTTNDEAIYKPNVHIAITSRTPKFKRDDVVDRLLLFKTIRIDSNIPFATLAKHIHEKRSDIWLEILLTLNKIICGLPNTPPPDQINHRMADFAALCLRISSIFGERDTCQQVLDGMRDVNADFLFDGDPLFDSLAQWIGNESNIDKELSAAELLEILRKIAKSLGKQMKDFL